MGNYKEFAEKHGLILTSKKVSERKDGLMDRGMDHWDCTLMYEGSTYVFYFSKGFGHNRGMDHWDCTLMYEGSTYGFYFSKGFGHKGAIPKIEEVLACAKIDLSCRDMDFEEFCEKCGYNNDSIHHKEIYKAIMKQNKSIINLLGKDLVEELLAIED